MLELPPLALYIHYPWCVKKCPYCDFNSHEGSIHNGYIKALLKDLDDDLKFIQNRKIHSIFIGGGTPSLMSIEDAYELFDGLNERLSISKNIEITLEANPGTFEVEKFAEFRKAGINRLSVGVQSFKDNQLKFLGRIHSGGDALRAISEAKKVGFDNLNIDLMYGLKDQTIDMCLEDVMQAIALKPSHISFYQLTLEPNTLFAKYPPKLPIDEKIWNMGEQAAILLNHNGFRQYEVSAYSERPSEHNINYWKFGDYIGIGAGAHGKITDVESQQIFRTLKPKSPKDYLSKMQAGVDISTKKEVDNVTFEFMLNSLRLKGGFSSSLFESRTGLLIKSLSSELKRAENLGLLESKNNWIKPTSKGFNFLNELQEIFL
ncbi:MAG: radical SAM family heme chaperone HemW [Gammaproteobacteria bacterium]|nr:radical SAM family heme chaperone HemW [SAR86 cluster bacterium]MBT7391153.1 radical SAM family heme chaperone HemW [Gammaproteobacteria bacterium]